MGLLSKISLSVSSDLTKTAGLATARVPLAKVYQAVLNSGIGAGNADLVYHAQRTLAASATEDLDLIGTMLQDPLGANLSMLRVKGLIVGALGVTDPITGAVTTPNTNNVVVGAAATNAWATLLNATGTLTLRPGSVIAGFAGQADSTGWVATAGTGDLLKVANSGAGSTVTYDIILIGTTA